MKIDGTGAGGVMGGLGPVAGSIGGPARNPMVDRIMEAERAPIGAAEGRKARTITEKNEYGALNGLLTDLDGALGGLKTPSSFTQMSLSSSHPEILDGLVDGPVNAGSFEFEVRGLATADKHLAFGFPDVDKTQVGFGFMRIGGDAGPIDVTVKPGSTLKDVAASINEASKDVRAQVINTGDGDEPFRLLVASTKTGEAAKIDLDPDTTFLDFKNLKPGKDLDLKFEDVDIKRPGNKLNDLLSGVKLDAKRAEPGTKVQVDIKPDIEKTAGGVKEFTEKYNQIARFMNGQTQVDAATGKAGNLSGDGGLRSVMRSLQRQVQTPGAGIAGPGQKFGSLADIGITTNAKSGELQVDDTKLKSALETDHESVARLFTHGAEAVEGGIAGSSDGIAVRLSNAIKQFSESGSGVVSSRLKSLDKSIKMQDQQIERQTARLDQRREQLEQQFSGLSAKMAQMEGQGQILTARMGGPQGNGGGAAG